MSLRWVDDDTPIFGIPRQRQHFFVGIERALRAHDPGAQARIEAELRAWLDNVVAGSADYASVERNAGADWTGFERLAIWDVTLNFDSSRWWCGLLLIRVAIMHHAPFMAYKPGEPGSEISTAYFRDRRAPR